MRASCVTNGYTLWMWAVLAVIVGCGKSEVKPVVKQVESDNLIGTWKAVAMMDNMAKEVEKQKVTKMNLTYSFEPETLRVRYDAVEAFTMGWGDYPYRLNSAKSPKELDMYFNGKWVPGIYELKEDVLRIRWGFQQRPTSLADDSDDNTKYLVLERVQLP